MTPNTAVQSVAVGSELAFIIIVSGFMGYFIGNMISPAAGAIGLTLGLLLGLVGGIYRMYIRFR